MCTAVSFQTKDFYFGRSLDYERSFGEQIVITPRNHPLRFLEKGEMGSHYAMIGMASVQEGYPLYYDAVNEMGLAIAGLNFVGNAHYFPSMAGKDNIAQFELIPWLLGQCANLCEARALLAKISLLNANFRPNLPAAQLHWMIADKSGCITLESMADGLHIHENPVGVLTNNPPFEMQLFNLSRYMDLSVSEPENRFSQRLNLKPYSRGMGAMGLPGDLSSTSRFVRAAFVKLNSLCGDGEAQSVSQFFHILQAVDQQRGLCKLPDGAYEISIYSACCNCERGVYYYRCYDNHRINAVDMHRENLDGEKLIGYALNDSEDIRRQN